MTWSAYVLRRRRGVPAVVTLVCAALGVTSLSTLVIDVPARAAVATAPTVAREKSVPGKAVPVRAAARDRTKAAAVTRLATPSWPAATASQVTLSAGGAATAAVPKRAGGAAATGVGGSWAKAGTGPVSVAPVTATSPSAAKATQGKATPVTGVRVTTYDRAAAARAGVDGLLLAVARADGGSAGKVAVKVDYGRFAGAVGGDWASRLRLVSLPACALTTPEVSACQVQTPLSSTNDPATSSVTGVTPVPAASASSTAAKPATQAAPAAVGLQVLALAAGVAGPAGSYAATSLAPSAQWQVGAQSGNFSWSYPIGVPPAVNGPAPSLGLSYSSGSIDGRTASTNNQSSWVGDGWDLETGYIQRHYVACGDDKNGGNNSAVTISGDQCWRSDNASLVLNGHSGDLVKIATATVTVGAVTSTKTTWKIKNDDGTRVERFTALGVNADNDKEYWKVTTPDGTQYHFGLGRRYATDTVGTTATDTKSTWSVPVAGNQTGEPCNAVTFAASFCTQAWRWNLDYVVDPFGNSMTLFYQRATNNYGQNNNSKVVGYDRSGWLDHIDYGQRAGSEAAANAPMRVNFAVAERCLPSGAITCTEAQRTTANASFWPDTPVDQLCASTTTCPKVINPAFFSTKRLRSVTTRIWDTSAATPAYKDVDSWALTHSFPATGDGTSPALWLASLVHTGKVGGTVALPSVDFAGVQLENRVPSAAGDPLLIKWRISGITSETGSAIAVNYLPQECSSTNRPTSPVANTKRCFPVFWSPEGASAPVLTYFHKYPVASIVESDLVGGGPAVLTSYSYLDTPAYHYDENELVQPKYRTWGDARGYGRVRVTRGDVTDTRTVTEYRYLRGMDGDCLTVSAGTCATRRTGVSVSDSLGRDVADHERAAGWQLEETTYNGVGGPEVSAKVDTPWISAATGVNGNDKSYLIGAGKTETRTALAAGGSRTTQVNTTFDATYGMATQIEDLGDTSTAGVRDEQCTRFSYARNTTAWIVDAVSRVENVSVACSATPSRPEDVTSDVRTYYDGATTFGAAPTQGAVTKTEVMTGWTTAPVYTTQNTTTYDAHGRVTKATDALNRTTTTAYTPVTGGPVTAVKTTDPKLFTNTTTIDPTRGAAIAEVDANSNRTDLQYDALGRLTSVWMPGHNKASFATSPNLVFNYTVTKTAPTVVRSREMRANGTTYTDTYAIFDGLLRPRQAQAPAEGDAGGRVITETKYDSLGRIVNQNGPWFNSAGASGTLLDALDTDKLSVTIMRYDGAGRATDSILMSAGAEKWRSTTSYGGDRAHVTPPSGAAPTTTITDARGRVTALRQYKGSKPSGAYDETTYTYRPDGNRSTVTAAGATWSYGYDLRGRLTTSTDPDQGTSTTTYDNANRVVATKDGRGKSLFYEYDELDRRTAVRDGSATGPILSSWTYDTLAKGKLTSSTRFVDGNAYVQAVTGYDEAYHPTGGTVTIPASEGRLAGTYTTAVTYAADGAVKTITPATLPGLPDERQALGYNGLGNPITLGSVGVGAYVAGTQYSVFGEAQQYAMGPTIGKTLWQTNTYDPVTRRLTRIEAQREGITGRDADLNYTYDPAGNITKIKDDAPGQSDTQCFTHDPLQRLTDAWTATDNCAAPPSTAVLGGVSPYWTSWTYSASGNRLSQTKHATTAGAGDTTSTYTYPAAGAAQPHAVQSVTTTGPAGSKLDNYSYDDAGNTDSRNLAGVGETLTWDSEGHLASHTKGDQTTSFLYNADGGRLIRREPGGVVTLYLDNAELKLTTATNTLASTRYYVFNGDTVAVRTSNGTALGDLKLLISDHQGTADLAVDGTTGALTRRRFSPFGETRGTAPLWPSQRAFVGGVNDATTGLTHLGAREYDPTIGRFISVDPILDLGNPQQLQGYAYANSSPVTASDPSGLITDGCGYYGYCSGYVGDGTGSKAPDNPVGSSRPSSGGSRHGGGGGGGSSSSSDQSSSAAGMQQKADAAAALAALVKARAVREAQKQKLIQAAKALMKIAADELGITAALDCFSSGNLGACAETAVNVISTFAGGLAGKLIAKYGSPWRWAKGAKLVNTLWKLSGQAIGAIKGWYKAGKEVGALENAASGAAHMKDNVVEAMADSCPIGNSFTPDTQVLMADGATMAIADVKLGDKVLSSDLLSGNIASQPVVATIVGE